MRHHCLSSHLPVSTGSPSSRGVSGRRGTFNVMYYPQEILFQVFSIRHLRDTAEFAVELEKAQSVLVRLGSSSAE